MADLYTLFLPYKLYFVIQRFSKLFSYLHWTVTTMTIIFFYKISFVIRYTINFHTNGFANIFRNTFKKWRVGINLSWWTGFGTTSFYACIFVACFRYFFIDEYIITSFFRTGRYAWTVLSAALITLDSYNNSIWHLKPQSRYSIYVLSVLILNWCLFTYGKLFVIST